MSTYYAKTLFNLLRQDIPDGIHTYHCTTNDIEIEFQIINYVGGLKLKQSDTFGNTTTDSQMLILKCHGDLTINSDVILTPQVRKKGMLIYVSGTLTNNGTISMTARGANAVGQNVYLYKNELVPAIGSSGGGKANSSNGKTGTPGVSRGTGGGGSGGSFRGYGTGGSSETYHSGAGAAGSSYSGGPGGGGYSQYDSNYGKDGTANGGAGGAAQNKTSGYAAGGGAGNPGGAGYLNGVATASYNGKAGTGGLLIMFARKLVNNGTISSDGSQGGGGSDTRSSGGGGSGGGSVNIFYNTLTTAGTTTATGGAGGTGASRTGGTGGAGTVTTMKIADDIMLYSKNIKDKVYTKLIDAIDNYPIITYEEQS